MLVLHGCRLRQTVVLAHTNDENDHMHFVPCIAIRYIMYLRFVRRCVVIATRMFVDNVRLWLCHVSVHTLCIVCVRLPSCKYKALKWYWCGFPLRSYIGKRGNTCTVVAEAVRRFGHVLRCLRAQLLCYSSRLVLILCLPLFISCASAEVTIAQVELLNLMV